MEGVRVGSGRAEFLEALEDRVKTVEAQWSPVLQLHYPDKLDDCFNKVLVETGERFFKKEPMDAPGFSDLAAKRRELFSQRWRRERISGWTVSVGRMDWGDWKSLSNRSELRRNSWPALQRLAWKKRDLAATFRWSRLLGGGRWGAKKRNYRAMMAALPSKKAWQDEWTKPGAEGGMSATVLGSWSECRAQSRDLEKQSMLRVGAVTEARRDMTSSAVTSRLRKDVLVLREHPLRSFGLCSFMPRGNCRQRAKGSDTKRRRSCLQAT